jgi:hypothetical protein
MPICRWRLGDILLISKRFAGGESAYALARGLCESLACLLHLREWIDNASDVVAVLAREMGLLDAEPPRPAARHPGEALALAGHFSRWSTFTHSFSRTFYPARYPLRCSHTILTG